MTINHAYENLASYVYSMSDDTEIRSSYFIIWFSKRQFQFHLLAMFNLLNTYSSIEHVLQTQLLFSLSWVFISIFLFLFNNILWLKK